MASVNTLAVVDAAISKLKRIISGYNSVSWNESLKKATRVFNESPNQNYLMGSAPDDYEKSPALQYELSKQSGLDVKHNNDKFKDRQEKLIQKGAFRIPMDREEWQRIDQPTFSGEVYKVQEGNAFIGSDVLDSTGKRHDSKVVLPGSGGGCGRTFPIITTICVDRQCQNIIIYYVWCLFHKSVFID